ncbi:MAG: Maf family protein [Erysipelotrichaceae bacterium]
MKKLILASQSPRRRELMMMLNLPFLVVSSRIDETIDQTLDVEEEIKRVAKEKAEDIFALHPEAIVVGADTLVVLDNEVLGKPRTPENAFNMLKKLSGKTHRVITGVCIKSEKETTLFAHTSYVTFYDLTDEEITSYVDTREPLDKAGGYGIQGRAALFVKHIEGDYYSVMGLPISKVHQELLKHFA